MAYRTYSVINGFVVAQNGTGDFTTLAAAVAAATEGQSIFITPGTYAENITINKSLNFFSYTNSFSVSNFGNAQLRGVFNVTAGVSLYFEGMNFFSDSNYQFICNSGGQSIISIQNCLVYATGHKFFNFLDTTIVDLFNSSVLCGGAASLYDFNANATLNAKDTFFYFNSESGNTINNNAAGSVMLQNCYSEEAFQSSGTGSLSVLGGSIFNMEACFPDQTALIFGGSGTNKMIDCWITAGIATAVVVNSTATLLTSTITSSNAAAISGSSTVTIGDITFNGTSSNITCSINTVSAPITLIGTARLLNPLSHLYGGTDITSPGTAGNVLTSDGINWTSAAGGAAGGGGAINDIAISTAASANTTYNATAALTLTLPASPTQSDTIQIICSHAGPIVVQANTGQTIKLGANNSTSAGTATNTQIGDVLTMRYLSASTTWRVVSSIGNWSMA